MSRNDIAIVGFAEAKNALNTGRSVFDLAGEVMASVIEQTGIAKTEINGFAVCASLTEAGNSFWSVSMSDCLGLELDWCQTVDLGGASFVAAVARASDAIRVGACDTVLVLAADAPTTADPSRLRVYRPEWQHPIGLMGPPGAFGLLSNRYDAQYGLDRKALAKLAVTQREHALLNENACEKLRKPITTEDYLKSRMISEPISLLDCVMPCDGANAVLVTSTERARKLGFKRWASLLGYGERSHYKATDPCVDITETGHSIAGARALSQAGLQARDIQLFQPYDDFLIAVVLQLEQIGFCKPGEGCKFIMDTDISYRGSLPINTGGGQISAGQAGLAGGGLNFVEAIRQLMGKGGARQVRDPGHAMVTGIGSIPYGRNWSTSTVMILESVEKE